jgi:hypothetical protein
MAVSNLGAIVTEHRAGRCLVLVESESKRFQRRASNPSSMAGLPVEPGCRPVSVRQGRALVS